MRSIPAALVLLFAIGCGGDDGGSVTPDAAPSNLPACTGVAYDPCTDVHGNTDCGTGTSCRVFTMPAYTVCSPACDANTPCPADKNGTAGECTMGRCRAEPNECAP